VFISGSKSGSRDFETPGSVGIRVPAVPDTDFGPNGEAVTANPKHRSHLEAAYPPNPLYPSRFSEDGGASTFLAEVKVAAFTEGPWPALQSHRWPLVQRDHGRSPRVPPVPAGALGVPGGRPSRAMAASPSERREQSRSVR
jgi:hypothetical protein